MHRLLRLLAVAAIVCFSCATGTPSRSAAADEQAVRAAMSGFMDALNRLDVDGMAGYFASDITHSFPSRRRTGWKDALP